MSARDVMPCGCVLCVSRVARGHNPPLLHLHMLLRPLHHGCRFCYLPRDGSSQVLNYGYALGLVQSYAEEHALQYENIVAVRFDMNVRM